MAATKQQQQRTMAVTIKQVALEAGVSKTTAVCVLYESPLFNVPEATRRRVRVAAERLGYRRNALSAALSRPTARALSPEPPAAATAAARSAAEVQRPCV